MKIKQIFFKLCLGIVILFAAQNLLGGFEFSKSGTYTTLFLLLFVASEWLTTRIRIFFLLPNLLPFSILLHSALIFVLFYVANHFIAGITVTHLRVEILARFTKEHFLQNLGEFGTISVVSICMGVAYQMINWFNNEK
ncbi:hypothetical protein IT418_02605 [bacterium]|nr:hypothetical protein [bacterium]